MRFSSLIKTIAGTVATALSLTLVAPVHADTTTDVEHAASVIGQQVGPLVADEPGAIPAGLATQQKLANADAVIGDVRDSGNTLVLAKGHFARVAKNQLAIIGQSGKELVRLPLRAVWGEQMIDLSVVLSEGGTAATFSPVNGTARELPVAINDTRVDLLGGPDSRLRQFYTAWGRYLNRMEVENFPGVVAAGIAGGIAGIAVGWGIGFLAGAVVWLGMGIFRIVPIVNLLPVVVFVAAGLTASLIGAPLGAILGTIAIGLTSKNKATREAAGQALLSLAKLIFLFWLPPQVDRAVGSGVGPTGPEEPEPIPAEDTEALTSRSAAMSLDAVAAMIA